jgi:hypothetical protein
VDRYSDDALREVVAEYQATKNAALVERDARLRAFHAAGWRPVDLQRITGYSRETIRQALRPEVRHAANDSRRRSAAVGPPDDYLPYAARKPYVVAGNLSDLRGPTSGSVTLPGHLDWSGDAVYDLDKPARLASMYKTVLNEAASVDDLNAWLDKQTLLQLWPSLWLPPRVRQLWERRFATLAATRTTAA